MDDPNPPRSLKWGLDITNTAKVSTLEREIIKRKGVKQLENLRRLYERALNYTHRHDWIPLYGTSLPSREDETAVADPNERERADTPAPEYHYGPPSAPGTIDPKCLATPVDFQERTWTVEAGPSSPIAAPRPRPHHVVIAYGSSIRAKMPNEQKVPIDPRLRDLNGAPEAPETEDPKGKKPVRFLPDPSFIHRTDSDTDDESSAAEEHELSFSNGIDAMSYDNDGGVSMSETDDEYSDVSAGADAPPPSPLISGSEQYSDLDSAVSDSEPEYPPSDDETSIVCPKLTRSHSMPNDALPKREMFTPSTPRGNLFSTKLSDFLDVVDEIRRTHICVPLAVEDDDSGSDDGSMSLDVSESYVAEPVWIKPGDTPPTSPPENPLYTMYPLQQMDLVGLSIEIMDIKAWLVIYEKNYERVTAGSSNDRARDTYATHQDRTRMMKSRGWASRLDEVFPEDKNSPKSKSKSDLDSDSDWGDDAPPERRRLVKRPEGTPNRRTQSAPPELKVG